MFKVFVVVFRFLSRYSYGRRATAQRRVGREVALSSPEMNHASLLLALVAATIVAIAHAATGGGAAITASAVANASSSHSMHMERMPEEESGRSEAARQLTAHRVPMNGACAVIARSNGACTRYPNA